MNYRILKKSFLWLLVLSEGGLIFYARKATEESLNIATHLLTSYRSEPLDDLIYYFSWGLAGSYNLASILSIGELKTSMRATQPDPTLKWDYLIRAQCFIFLLTYLAGSLAAPEALWADLSLKPWSIALGIFLFLGQLTLFFLQTNKRIYTSAPNMRNLFTSLSPALLLNRSFLVSSIMALANITYQSTVYYYIGMGFCTLFSQNKNILLPISVSFACLGGYFTFATQSVDQLSEATRAQSNNSNEVDSTEEKQCAHANIFSLSLSIVAFLYKTIVSISFGYSILHSEIYQANDFNRQQGWYSLYALLPGALSGAQYAFYAHNQVRASLNSIKKGMLAPCQTTTLPLTDDNSTIQSSSSLWNCFGIFMIKKDTDQQLSHGPYVTRL